MDGRELHDFCMTNDTQIVRFGAPETLDGLPYFRTLYRQIELYCRNLDSNLRDPYNFIGDGVYSEIILPWMPSAQAITGRLEQFRQLSTLGDTRQYDDFGGIQWYALSRLNDMLLADLCSVLDYAYVEVPPGQESNYSGYLEQKHRSNLDKYRRREAEYTQFFRGVGMEVFYDRPYHPFSHEIVSVTFDERIPPGEIVVGDVFWPGLMFGNMMFARAGAHVLCCQGTMEKSCAETSTLYWAYMRPRRRATDLSAGWGSNSQWNTFFRLDYQDDEMFHFNVWHDHHWLDDFYLDSWPPHRREEKSELTIEERIELLTHRCFVSYPDRGESLWPWDDTYSMPRLKSTE